MEKYLYDLGINKDLVGYQYLLDILELINNDRVLTIHICKAYDIVAEKYGKSRQYVSSSLMNVFRTPFLKKRTTKDQIIYLFNTLKKKKLI